MVSQRTGLSGRLDNGVPFHPPGWPLLLALFFKAAGFAPLDGRPVDPAAVKAFVACLSGAAVGLTVGLAVPSIRATPRRTRI